MPKKIPKQVKLVKDSYIKQSKSHKHISYSQLFTYLSCKRKWELQYLRNVAPYEPSIHAVFGSAFHETLQNYLDVMYNDTAKAANEIDTNAYLYERMVKNYKRQKMQNGNEHFSDPDEMNMFWLDGKHILEYIKKKRGGYFSKKNTYLAGIETLLYQEISPGIYFKGFIDLVFYNKYLDEYTLVDIKTSTKGWNKFAKADDKKIFQLLLYKEFFAKQFNVPIEKVNVEYFIVKRRVPVEADFASMQRRVQEFKPTDGKIKRGKAISAMNNFIKDVLDENREYIDKTYPCTGDRSPCWHCNVYDGVLQK
jgi:predicted nuclease of restriction endonuclease-like (RecB) superfamily|tara:strand:+ start:1172 stop:2095 length:924 start_codon:yes stop_codon:yes gene_type:complete